jgi:RNA polymerase sigma-70 factor (ECF subfamily)
LDFSSLDDSALLKVIARYYGKASSEEPLNAAVGTLYNRFGRLVFSIAIRIVGDIETAEEITQDVFVRACEGAGGYRSGLSKVSTWMVSITRHRAIDELRRRSVRPENEVSNWPEDDGIDQIIGLPFTEGPELEVENIIQSEGIREIVAGLPPEQQQALHLAYFKGLSHSQIATFLGEPLGTIKSRVRLAMDKLRDTFVERGLIDSS